MDVGELLAVPSESPTVDIHCMTKWTKLDTTWRSVSVDTLLSAVSAEAPYVPHLYFWKRAKWVRGLTLDGDRWLEQRYRGD